MPEIGFRPLALLGFDYAGHCRNTGSVSPTTGAQRGDAARVLLEEAVAGAYRERRLTTEQVRHLLGYGTRMQVDAFLLQHEIYDYTVEGLDADMATLERLFPSKPDKQQA